ncbi:MAG: nuclease-related domain-containing protein, partial [Anaerolineales bacterium]
VMIASGNIQVEKTREHNFIVSKSPFGFTSFVQNQVFRQFRWVRKPRPEESLGAALKSFDDHYHIYHYPSLPCDHLLLTPTGVTILETFNLSGNYFYRQNRWKETMTIGRALRYIVEEHVGDPIALARQDEAELDRRFKKEFGLEVAITIKSVVVFTHPAVNLEVEESSIPICKIDKLKKQVIPNASRLAPEQYERLSSFLESRTIH